MKLGSSAIQPLLRTLEIAHWDEHLLGKYAKWSICIALVNIIEHFRISPPAVTCWEEGRAATSTVVYKYKKPRQCQF